LITSIILIGPPGSGKTTVGKILAARLKWPFLDSDELIVERTGLTVPEIFSQHGEAHFRRLETEAVNDLIARRAHENGLVLATGGGLPVSAENFALLVKLGSVVFLGAEPACLAVRLSGDRLRPLLKSAPGTGSHPDDMESKLRALLDARISAYLKAPYKVDTQNLSPDEVSEAIVNLLGLG